MLNGSRMLCPSPSLRQSTLNASLLSSSGTYPLCYGFVMDGVAAVRNLSRPTSGQHRTGGRTFSVYADPQFQRFDDGVKRFFYLPNEYLTINVSVADVLETSEKNIMLKCYVSK